MKRFTMYRRNVPDETHNAFQKNAPDQPQFEGVVFSDGTCAIRWMTACGSTAVWKSFDDMMTIHGHPEYGSELVWHDRQGIHVSRTKRGSVGTTKRTSARSERDRTRR